MLSGKGLDVWWSWVCVAVGVGEISDYTEKPLPCWVASDYRPVESSLLVGRGGSSPTHPHHPVMWSAPNPNSRPSID